jgi:hypothetical protein
MRLSDAGLRRRQSKLIYPNHRLPPCVKRSHFIPIIDFPPWHNEDDTRDRSNRLLDEPLRQTLPYKNAGEPENDERAKRDGYYIKSKGSRPTTTID